MASRKVQRTFNYLDRVRLPASGIQIEATTDASGEPVARVRRLDLPPVTDTAHDPERWRRAEVFVEAWRGRSANWGRHPLGTVAELDRKLKGAVDLALPGFESADDLSFRVKVVAADTQQLLAEAERIRPSNEAPQGARQELILVRKEPSLGEEPWRIGWDDDDGPVVLVSSKLTDCETFFTRNAAYAAAMVPEIMRNVLFRLGLSPDLREAEWAKKWLAFVARFDEAEPPAEAGDWEGAQGWADGVVRAFCDQRAFVSAANSHFGNVDPTAA